MQHVKTRLFLKFMAFKTNPILTNFILKLFFHANGYCSSKLFLRIRSFENKTNFILNNYTNQIKL